MGISREGVFLYDSIPVKVDDREEMPGLRTVPDALLVERARRKGNAAFVELLRRYRNEVFALSYHFVRNREDAWDISQEVFVKAYRSLRSFRGDASFKTWLMRITANHCKDHLKKGRLRTVPYEDALAATAPSGAPGPRKKLEASELGAAIQRAVEMLPAKHRTAFVLREHEGLSYQEMANVMHCSLGTVMSRLHHARKKLQRSLIEMGVMEET